MKINQTPYRTSRNYEINNIEIDESLFDKKLLPFANFAVENAQKSEIDGNMKVKTDASIDKKLSEQLEKSANKKVKLMIDKDTDAPIVVTYTFDGKHQNLADVLNIVVAKNVKAQVIVNYQSSVKAYHNCQIKSEVEENGKLDVCVSSNLDEESSSFVLFENILSERAQINHTIIDFGCKNSIQNFHAKLLGDEAKCDLKAMYLGKNDDVIDLNYLQDVYGKNCEATINVVGTLDEIATKNFKGTINFVKGCKKSFGAEDEFCMLLSKDAKSKALPMLLCGEEDVDGRHSSSVGKADAKELFYVMSRGLSQNEALKLIVKAKLNVIVDSIFDEEFKTKMLKEIDGKLNNEKN